MTVTTYIIIHIVSAILGIYVCVRTQTNIVKESVSMNMLAFFLFLSFLGGPVTLFVVSTLYFSFTIGNKEIIKSKPERDRIKQEKIKLKEKSKLMKDLKGGLSIEEFEHVKNVLGE
jgi:hypothetical protein